MRPITATLGVGALAVSLLVMPGARSANEWGTSTLVSSNQVSEYYGDLSMNGAGTEMVVRRDGNPDPRLQAFTRTGGTWGSPVDLLTPAGNYTQKVTVAEQADVVVYNASGGGESTIWTNRKTGGTWGSPERVDPVTGTLGNGSDPTISADGTTVAYRTEPFGGGNSQVYVSTWNGTSWQRSAPISTDQTSAYYPVISRDATSVAFVLYGVVQPGNDDGLFVSRLTNGSWSTPELVSGPDDVRSGSGYLPTFSADGDTLVYSRDNDFPTKDDLRVLHRASGSWSLAATMNPDLTEDLSHFTLSSNGRVILVAGAGSAHSLPVRRLK